MEFMGPAEAVDRQTSAVEMGNLFISSIGMTNSPLQIARPVKRTHNERRMAAKTRIVAADTHGC